MLYYYCGCNKRLFHLIFFTLKSYIKTHLILIQVGLYVQRIQLLCITGVVLLLTTPTSKTVRDRKAQTHRPRQTDRQTDVDRDWKRHKRKERKTEKDSENQQVRYEVIHRHKNKERDKKANRKKHKRTGRKTEKQKHRDRKGVRQTRAWAARDTLLGLCIFIVASQVSLLLRVCSNKPHKQQSSIINVLSLRTTPFCVQPETSYYPHFSHSDSKWRRRVFVVLKLDVIARCRLLSRQQTTT